MRFKQKHVDDNGGGFVLDKVLVMLTAKELETLIQVGEVTHKYDAGYPNTYSVTIKAAIR